MIFPQLLSRPTRSSLRILDQRPRRRLIRFQGRRVVSSTIAPAGILIPGRKGGIRNGSSRAHSTRHDYLVASIPEVACVRDPFGGRATVPNGIRQLIELVFRSYSLRADLGGLNAGSLSVGIRLAVARPLARMP